MPVVLIILLELTLLCTVSAAVYPNLGVGHQHEVNGNRGAPKHPIHGARGVSGYINVYASAYASV